MKKKPKPVELTQEELKQFLERVKSSLDEKDFETAKALVATLTYLNSLKDKNSATIVRMVRMIFGIKTESAKNVLEALKKKASDQEKKDKAAQKKKKKKPKGHGRNGHQKFTGAQRKKIPHEKLKNGDPCEECGKGKCYCTEPMRLFRFKGAAPVDLTIFELETLRCNGCGMIFRAEAPDDIGDEKYDETVGSTIANLKYDNGFPFNRLANLQKNAGIPLPASVQWEIVDEAAQKVEPVYEELKKLASQGEVIHNDDTTGKIISQILENKNENPDRKGIFTTGMLSLVGEHKIALFFTGRRHAGENLTELLKKRPEDLPPPIQMCDAHSVNLSKEFETLLANCLIHGRRNFVDVIGAFPEECRYLIEKLGEVYHFDSMAKKQKMSPDERLTFHQQKSGPVMEALKEWLQAQFDEKKVEPNSGLGKAIAYMLKHWEPLTLFLRVPGAPLDNNICERALKKAILHRKNALFYKTERGAFVGDIFMSLIHTCNLNGVNPFEYLTELQRHADEVAAHPEQWLPWNYRATLTELQNSISF